MPNIYACLFALAVAFCLTCANCFADPLVIRGNSLQLSCDPAQGAVTIASLPDRRTFASGTLVGGRGAGKVVDITDKTFGKGQCIEITHDNGSIDRLMLFPTLPFALFRATLHNSSPAATTLNKVPLAALSIDLNVPATDLKMLGTGGLASLDKEIGSYMWLAIAEPKSRRGVVSGFITTDRGSGVLFMRPGDRPTIAPRVEYGRLRLAPDASAESETFAIARFDDARIGLEIWADTVARVYNIHLPPQPVGYCTWYHAGAWNEKALAAHAEFAAKNLKPFGFSVVQIDDGWQDGEKKNGPRKNFTRVRPDGPYPSGMKAMADKIRAAGLVPGIWFMPFSGSYDDPWFKDHQDWFVKHDDGTPHVSPWGGTAIDMTSPGAQEYLRDEVKRIVHDWGYRYLKMDGLTSGVGVQHVYVNDAYKDDHLGDGVFHNPDKTNIEAFRDGLKLIREAAGPETYILGCTVAQNMRSYGGAMGLVDAMRIGPDNNWQFKSLITGPKYGTRNYFLHGRIWHNDPDCVYARPQMPLHHAQVIASWAALSGQLNISSEDFAKLPPERLDILKRTMPAHGQTARPVDLFDQPLPRIWLVTDRRGQSRHDVIGLFNWSDAEATFDSPFEWIGLNGKADYVAFDYWGNKLVVPFNTRLALRVPAQSCVVISARAMSNHPQVVSTSRHITQGMVDLSDEKWNPDTRELTGRSKIVADDPYELRIALQTTNGLAQPKAFELSDADRAAGVTADMKSDGALARVTIKSPQSREVAWRFTSVQLRLPPR